MPKKVSALTASTNPGRDAIFHAVITPGTTPTDRKTTIDDLFKSNTGNYSVLAYASLSAAITAIGANPATLEIPASMGVTADLTIPENVTLLVIGVGAFNVSSTKTLTINGALVAPLRQIFTGAGSVVLGPRTKSVNPYWFGATGSAKQVTDAAMATGTSVITSATAAFTSSMIGMVVDMQGVGASAADTQGITSRHNVVGTITGFNSSTSITVSFGNSGASVTGKTLTFGTDDSSAIVKAKVAMSANAMLYFPPGKYVANSEISLGSNTCVSGYGIGASVIYWVGPARNTGSSAILFYVGDGIQNVSIRDLSIFGTNVAGIGVTAVAGIHYGIKIGTGSGGTISNITIQNVECGYVWGMGMRSDGDTGDQAGSTPTVKNIKALNCYIHHSADNGINLNTGGGLLIQGCYLTDNGSGGIEFAGSRVQILNNYIARNLNVGVALGGLGNPSLGKDNLLNNNIIERNGNAASDTGNGVQIGGNVIHAIISNNIIRENEFAGIGLTDGTPDFASLSRDIRIVSNQIISNGESGLFSIGIYSLMNDVIIESNDIRDDGVSGFAQYYGVLIGGNGTKLLRNHVHNNTGYDYSFVQNSNTFLVRDDITATVQQYEPNGWAGTVDTSTTTVTYKTGTLFSSQWVGVPIKIDTAYYVISAVAAAPSGNFTTSGLTVTRTSGTNFDSAWVGQYIRLGADLYFPIASVGGASTLTITNPIGNTVPASGAWVLKGSVSATLTTSAGTQSGKAYVIPPHVVYPVDNSVAQTVAMNGGTPIFDAAQGNVFKITLTANVTASELVNGAEGQIVTFIITQDGGSARTFVWPTNAFGAMTISATLGKINIQSFRKLGGNWYGVAAGQTGLG